MRLQGTVEPGSPGLRTAGGGSGSWGVWAALQQLLISLLFSFSLHSSAERTKGARVDFHSLNFCAHFCSFLPGVILGWLLQPSECLGN